MYIIKCAYYIHMIHNIYTYNIVILSYYIHILEFENKFKILKNLYSNYTYIYYSLSCIKT
jgi:hypothetical protein